MRSLVLLTLVAASCSTPTAGRFLRRSGCDLYYEVTGSGPPLILVHGAADRRIFDPVVSQLSKKLTVIRYDQRGYGLTRVRNHDGPATTLATDVCDLDLLRAALGFKRVHVLALSNGGPIAIDYALTYPHAVDKMILVDTYADNDARTVMAWPLIREVLSDPLRVQHMEQITADKQLDKVERQIQEFLLVPHTHHELPLPRRWVEGWYRGGCLGETQDAAQAKHRSPPHRAYGKMDMLPRIETPTLVICGERDRVTPLEHSKQMAARLPNGRLAVIAGTGHLAFAEKPDEFVRLVRTFLLGRRQRPPL